MNEIIKKDILSIIAQTLRILGSKEETDTIEMKELSNHTMHNASIFQDEDSVSIAILTYSISKLIERHQGNFNNKMIVLLKNAESFLLNDYLGKYRNSIKKTFKIISSMDSKLKLYIEEVINQAQIKKGSKLYDHGLSMERASSILGISEWELMNYIGKTNITEIPLEEPIDVKTRLKFARKLFT